MRKLLVRIFEHTGSIWRCFVFSGQSHDHKNSLQSFHVYLRERLPVQQMQPWCGEWRICGCKLSTSWQSAVW